MLFGEHAVLQKNHAISIAIDKRIYVEAKKRTDDAVIIKSSLGTYSGSRHSLIPQKPFSFVLEAIKSQNIPQGLELEIHSEMSPLFGLGTSAAVTLATIKALSLVFNLEIDLFTESLQVIRSVQKRGSGADIAASLYGGTVFYQMEPCCIVPLNLLFDLTVIYSGSKMATPDVIDKVLGAQQKHAALFDLLFTAMDKITLDAKEAALQGNLKAIGELCNLYQGLMDALGVNTQALSEIVYDLRKAPDILGSKISGSGLGDCAIGIGRAQNLQTRFPILTVSLTSCGVLVE